MGGSQSREELAKCKADLQTADQRGKTLKAERDTLQGRLDAQEAELQQARESLARAATETVQQLESKDEALSKAVKQKEMAEELRRSDALLAKRLLHAQLRHLGGGDGGSLPSIPDGAEEGTMAAGLALAAQDEMQLRQMLMHTANELEAAQQHVSAVKRAQLADRTSELGKQLWPSDLCDVSFALRSPQILVMGGLRMPRAPTPGVRAAGLSPGVAVLRQFGDPTSNGQWAAVGGSLLYDAREHEISAMRLALAAQPASNQQVALSFDHTGGLTGSVKASRNSLSARLFGTLDLNRKGAGRAGLEMTYDIN